MTKFADWVKTHQAILFFLIIGLAARLINYPNRLYFTWDQGRDAFQLQQILQGDLTLIGPTSGLAGFFLGPLWYYAGIPGMLLSQGNPYLISLWYTLIACVALPIFWKLGFTLFPEFRERKWAIATAYLLALLPGSIKGSVFIWNPLLSLPLVSFGLLALLKSRTSLWWLVAAFLSWALVLQSEFAYGIFFLGPLWLAIAWLRGKFDWKEYVLSAVSAGITFIPQLVFELRHHFLMSQSLWKALSSPTDSIGWWQLWSKRPSELFWVTQQLFFGEMAHTQILMRLILAVMIWGVWHISKMKPQSTQWQWQLVAGLAILPYCFYMLWRGNQGNFFDYYVTPHFIFLVPVVVFGLRSIGQTFAKLSQTWFPVETLILGVLVTSCVVYLEGQVTFAHNEGGLRNTHQALAQIYDWRTQDQHQDKSGLYMYTSSFKTEQYDYLNQWYAQAHGEPQMHAAPTDRNVWYLLIEPDNFAAEQRFIPWYQEVTDGGVRIRSQKQGQLILETYANRDIGAEMGYLAIPPVEDLVSTTVEVEFLPDHNE